MIRKLASGKYRLYSRKKNPKTNKRRNLVSSCKNSYPSLAHLFPHGFVLALDNFHSRGLRAPHFALRKNLSSNLNTDFCSLTLGTFNTRDEAVKHEREIQFFKSHR